MAFRHVEKPYKTCRKWRILRSPECSNLGENNIVYGVSNEISQKVRISEFYFTWMGGVIAITSDPYLFLIVDVKSATRPDLILIRDPRTSSKRENVGLG